MISAQLLQKIINYLSAKPYKEVAMIMSEIQKELSTQTAKSDPVKSEK